MEVTRRLAGHAAGLRFDRLPAATVDKAKQCLLDHLGIAIRAAHDADSTPAVRAAVADLAALAPGSCTAVGHGERYPAQYAALLNGTYAHSLDFDDTHAPGSLHPGAPVIPAALAIAEERRASGRDLLAALVAGYDVACRVALALTPKSHYDRGFHPTATAGTFGAAAAAARAAGLDAGRLEHAFGLNGSQAAGSLQFFDNGAWNKRVHVGLAAHNGVVSLRFAARGVVGATRALEGDLGFLRGYSDAPRPEEGLEALGERYEVDVTAFKPYPACRFTHSAIDAITGLVGQHDIRPDEIESMTVGLPLKGIDLVGEPADRKRDPQNVVDGQFSMPWTAAVAARTRGLTWADYALVRDRQILDLARRVEVVADERAEREYPANFAAAVTIRARGREFLRFVPVPKGEPAAPLSWDDLTGKFDGLAAASFPPSRRERIAGLVRGLERLDDVSALTALLRP